jgi:hypothetical protein
VWIRQFGSAGDETVVALAATVDGSVFAAGDTTGDLGGPVSGVRDAWLARLDPDGQPDWLEQFGLQGHGWTAAAAPRAGGGVFFGGATTGALGGPGAGGHDAWVARYSPNAAVPPAVYCTAKLNSLGCLPAIGRDGFPSAFSVHGFAVSATNVRNQKPGVLLYTLDGRRAAPFQGGVLCLAPPVRRTPARSSGGSPLATNDCSGGWRIDMNAFAAGAFGGHPDPGLRVPGAFVQCQWWGRDPGDAQGVALTDALQYQIGLE